MTDQLNTVEAIDNAAPALANRAIARCVRAFHVAHRECIDNKASETDAMKKAGEAYRATMPPLTDRENCRDFIACVAQGVLMGAIEEKYAGKLLYAAQVATAVTSAEELSRERAGYAVYANLSAAETERVKKFMPRRSKTS